MANFSLKENEYRPENIFPVLINPNLVSVLRQTRTSMNYNDLEDLKSSIKKRGQKKAGDIYAFSKNGAIQYLNCINILWNSEYRIQDFESHFIPEMNNDFYLFLVAGHRRLRAAKEVDKLYYAEIHFEKTFEEAIEWQLTENFQEPISLLDLITAANYLWVMLKGINHKLTMKEFAKNYIHKSVSWLNDALRFSRLPISVQELIKKTESNKGVGYNIMLEFAKLYDFSVEKGQPLNEELLLSMIIRSVSEKFDMAKIKDYCSLIRKEISGQKSLFALTLEEVKSDSKKAMRAKNTLQMSLAKQYSQTIQKLIPFVTENCKSLANQVIEEGEKINERLTSE